MRVRRSGERAREERQGVSTFWGLRHEPVSEDGVVPLFDIVARELGYSVQAIHNPGPCILRLMAS